MDKVVRRIRTYWDRVNAYAEPGASIADLVAFEARVGVRLPAAFAALYRAANATMADRNLTGFWPLAEIHRLSEGDDLRRAAAALPQATREYFVFADYMIFSHVYAVRLSAEGEGDQVLWVLDTEHQAEIAPSFEAFLRAYANDPDSILFPPEPFLGQASPPAL